MALRKATAYSKKFRKAYTRKSSVKGKSFIKTIPQGKIVKFSMGDVRKFKAGKFNYLIYLISSDNVLIRDNAIEAARLLILRHLEEHFKGGFFFSVSKYPHHILRENKMLTGAGADRMQTGMSQSFGSTIGIAARVKKNDKIFTIAVNSLKDANLVRKILKKAAPKLPCKCSIVIESQKQD